MDEDGYPTQDELGAIANWDFGKNSVDEFIKYIRERWQYANCGYFDLKGKRVLRLRLSTAGWSGNESIIEAMEQNKPFWWLVWVKSQRGGHYWFHIPLKLFPTINEEEKP